MFNKTHSNKITDSQLLTSLILQVNRQLAILDSDAADKLITNIREALTTTFVMLDGISNRKTALFEQIEKATTFTELGNIHKTLNEIEMERFLKIPSVPAIQKNCTEYRNHLAQKAIELLLQEMSASGNPAPDIRFSLICMGSDGREEQTLITDQDYLIVYDDGDESTDEWFAHFSVIFVERMVEVGFNKCTGDIMPSNPTWRGSISQWQKKLLSIVRYEYEDYAKNLMDIIVLSDARYVAGDKALADDLIDLIRNLVKDYFHALWGMAKAATEMRLALGFLKRIWTEGSGEHKEEFNLKLLAWAPLVMNVRIFSINQGVPATSTVERIKLLQKEGSFSEGMSEGLIDAYYVLTRHRILLQIKVIKGIQTNPHYINPYRLPAEEREKIRQAMLKIEDLQKVIHTNFHIV